MTKTEYKKHQIVGRIKVKGKMTNVYKSERDALYYITEPGRNRKYITGAKKRKVKKHKDRPYSWSTTKRRRSIRGGSGD